MDWLIFLSQLPTNPSSLRVTIWRRMRAAGALGLQNGTWVFPYTPENEKFMLTLLEYVKAQGAHGQIFKVVPLNQEIEADLLQRFEADREQEYSELMEGCNAFLAEIKKETQKRKFTFAELEEAEDDLAKLMAWLKKIQNRDFMKISKAAEAAGLAKNCQQAFDRFSQSVYDHEGLPDSD